MHIIFFFPLLPRTVSLSLSHSHTLYLFQFLFRQFKTLKYHLMNSSSFIFIEWKCEKEYKNWNLNWNFHYYVSFFAYLVLEKISSWYSFFCWYFFTFWHFTSAVFCVRQFGYCFSSYSIGRCIVFKQTHHWPAHEFSNARKYEWFGYCDRQSILTKMLHFTMSVKCTSRIYQKRYTSKT